MQSVVHFHILQVYIHQHHYLYPASLLFPSSLNTQSFNQPITRPTSDIKEREKSIVFGWPITLSWRRSSCSRSRICSGQWACCSRLHSVCVCVCVCVCVYVVRTWIRFITSLYGTHTISANEWVWMNKRELFLTGSTPNSPLPSSKLPPHLPLFLLFSSLSPSRSLPITASSKISPSSDASVCVCVRERECERAALRRDVSVWREREREGTRRRRHGAIGERACGGWVCDERRWGERSDGETAESGGTGSRARTPRSPKSTVRYPVLALTLLYVSPHLSCLDCVCVLRCIPSVCVCGFTAE